MQNPAAVVRIAAVLTLLAARPLIAGTVTGATVAPNPATTGTTVTVSVTGTNPCGAVHVIWGDGAAITYPITTLPSSHTHAYGTPGTFTIVAKGMGNCDGEVSTNLRIEAPPTPPAPSSPPMLTGVATSTPTTPPNVPVTITLDGRGACAVTVEFGDGNAQSVQGELPQRVRHNYPAAGTYTVSAAAQGPCTGAHRTVVNVAAARAGLVTRVALSSESVAPQEAATITIEGTGTCAVEVDFGDGNTQAVHGALPQRVTHTYSVARIYDVTAIAQPPCGGSRTARLRVEAARAARVTDVFVKPSPTRRNQPVTITIEGQGSCGVAVDFGDGNKDELSGPLPLRVTHNYPLDGAYEIVATAKAPCTGTRATVVDVLRR
jgi:hypothetical protein